MGEVIMAIVLALISISAFIMSIRSFKQRGFLFNNAYIYASKKEREIMDKKPYYRQSALVFIFIGIIFLLNAIGCLLEVDWIFYVVVCIVLITVIYAIISSILIEKNKDK